MALKNSDTDPDIADSNKILKSVLNSVILRCRTEYEQQALEVPLGDTDARTSYYTGLPNSFITKILADKPRISSLDLQSRILLLDTVRIIYTQDRAATFKSIFGQIEAEKLKTTDKKIIVALSVFVEEMEILGYQWKETISNSKIIMEDPDIRFERYLYLNKLRKMRTGATLWKQIVYVDERLINHSKKFEKPWVIRAKVSPELNESIFFHAVSKYGFINGMFSNQDSENDFTKWVTDILLSHLNTPSVIIMDNSPLHGTLENICKITKHHSKNDMLHWLTSHNIPCSGSMSKPVLYELIKKCNVDQQSYKIDRIIRSQGHEVLRLPRHFYDLSITTPLWNGVIENDDENDDSKTMVQLQNKLLDFVTNLKLQQWLEYEKYIERKEKEIYNIDAVMETHCDKHVLKV